MNILVLSPIEPFPVQGGWQTVIYNDVKFLAQRGHRVRVLALTYDRLADPEEMSDVASAEYFHISKPPRWIQVVGNFGHRLPFTVKRHIDTRLFSRALDLIRDGEVDIVLIEDVVMAEYATLLAGEVTVPTFLRGHNISTSVVERYYQSQRNPFLRFLGWRQYKKFLKYETAIMSRFDGVAQISPEDARLAKCLNPTMSYDVLYSGVDLNYFSMAEPDLRESGTIVHVGTLDPITKLPAMLWFVDEVLPRVRAKIPEARLLLVGRTPPSRLDAIKDDSVTIEGLVPDVRPYLARGAVFIAPQFVGSGIRIKILNAMACGNAVVATSVACEGLPVSNGEHLVIADDANLFAEQVIDLMQDADRRKRIGQAARNLIEREFSWLHIAENLEAMLQNAIESHKASLSL